MASSNSLSKTHWIWFAGALVWWISAALAVHYNHKLHALLSLSVSALFFIAGIVWMRMPPPPRRR